MNKLKEGIDYEMVVEDDRNIYFKILKGKYKDVVYQYGNVRIDQNEEKDLVVNFSYGIKASPIKVEKLEDDDFKNYIGDILFEVVVQHYNSELNEAVDEYYKGEKITEAEYTEV